MSRSSGIVSSPVTIDGDLNSALAYASKALGTIIANGTVNPWAKYKPINFVYTDVTGRTSGSEYWKGTDGRCGFSFSTFGSIGSPSSSSSFAYKLLHSQALWTYDQPSGSGKRFRLLDIDGYDEFAPAPVTAPTVESVMLTSSGGLTIQLGANRGNERSLHLSDFTVNNVSLNNYYVGLLIYYSSSQYSFVAASQVSGGDYSCSFTNMTAYGGRYVTVVPFLSSSPISQGVDPGGLTLLSVNVAPVTMLIKAYSTGIRTQISAQWADALHVRVAYTVRMINDTAADKTVYNISIALYRSGSQSALDTDTVSSVNVLANDTYDETGILIDNTQHQSGETYTVVVTSTDNVVSGTVEVDEYRS